MKVPIADAIAHACGFGAPDEVVKAELGTLEQGFEHVQQWRVVNQLGERGIEKGQLINLPHTISALFRSKNARVPLGIILHMVTLEEYLFFELRWEAFGLSYNSLQAITQWDKVAGSRRSG